MKKRESEIYGLLFELGITEARVEDTHNSHYRIVSEALKRSVYTSGSPSDFRTNANLKSEIRGVMLTPPLRKAAVKFNPLDHRHKNKKEMEFLESLSEDAREMIVARLLDGEHAKSVASDYSGLSLETLYEWKSEARKKEKSLKNNAFEDENLPLPIVIKPAKVIDDITSIDIDQALKTFTSFRQIISNQRKLIAEQAQIIADKDAEILDLIASLENQGRSNLGLRLKN